MTTSSALYTPVPGEKLSNGATIVAVREDSDDYWVVLAITNGEYVTWRVDNQEGHAYWGDYLAHDFAAAVESFNTR